MGIFLKVIHSDPNEGRKFTMKSEVHCQVSPQILKDWQRKEQPSGPGPEAPDRLIGT